MQTFVINLDKDTERMDALHDHLVACDLEDYERVPAETDWNEEMPSWMKHSCPSNVNGCFASHRKCWKEVIDRDLPCALVLEDDVRFTSDAPKVLSSALSELPPDFDILYLGCFGECDDTLKSHVGVLHSLIGFREPSSKTPVNSKALTVPKAPYGLHAYIISKKGAEILLEKTLPAVCHVDVMVGNIDGLAVYACDPIIAHQNRDKHKSNNIVDFPKFFNSLLGNPYEMNIKNFTLFGTVTITNFVLVLGVLVRFYPWLLVFLIPDLMDSFDMILSVIFVALITSFVITEV